MILNKYVINSELGHGGMAVVYLAHDNKFDTQVAVKVLNKEYVYNDNIRKRFLAEARNMYRMSHPNIIKVTDLIDDGNTVAFVMEYIEGETLKEYLERKGKLKDEEIKNIFTQMLDAVGYVHEQKLVHRDIKPSNFMVTPSGKVKLMDFGIAKNTDPNSVEYTQTGTGMQMGTPMYMSPEQVKDSKMVGAASDIYSLGVILWQMKTGSKPYEANSISNFELQNKIVNAPLEITNSQWDVLIQKATTKEITLRYISVEDFKNTLENFSSTNKNESEITIIENIQKKPERKTSVNKYEPTIDAKDTSERNEQKTKFNRRDNYKIASIFILLALGVGISVIVYNNFSNIGSRKEIEKSNDSPINIQIDNYIKFSDFCVQDLNTGYFWFIAPDKSFNFQDAITFANNVHERDLQWEIPTFDEIKSLYNPAYSAGKGYFRDNKHYPAKIHSVFNKIGTGSWFWVSDQNNNYDKASAINLHEGLKVNFDKTNAKYPVHLILIAK
jgi:serine/threonine protein kinase